MNSNLATFGAALLALSSLAPTQPAQAGDHWHHGGGPYLWGPPLPTVVIPPLVWPVPPPVVVMPPQVVIGFPPVVTGMPFYGQHHHDHGWHRGWYHGHGHRHGHWD